MKTDLWTDFIVANKKGCEPVFFVHSLLDSCFSFYMKSHIALSEGIRS